MLGTMGTRGSSSGIEYLLADSGCSNSMILKREDAVVPSEFSEFSEFFPTGFMDEVVDPSEHYPPPTTGLMDDPVDPSEFFPSPTTALAKLYPTNYTYTIRDVFKGGANIIVDNPVDLSEGCDVDIIDLLSNSGKRDFLVNKHGVHVPVNSVVGKCVVLLSTPVPIPNSNVDAVLTCRSIISACSCLASKVVLVIAALNVLGSEHHFNHFLSGFPGDTLAIPFSDVMSRARLTYSAYWPCQSYLSIIVVSPQGRVLQTDTGSKFYNYGSDLFPFTKKHLDRLTKADIILRLKLDPFYKESKKWEKYKSICDVVEKICSNPCPVLESLLDVQYLLKSDASKTCLVSQLSNKVVGIYLCVDGLYLDIFRKFEERCLELDPDFQMVLVCLALLEDLRSFLGRILLAMRMRNISSWWLSLSNEKTCRKLMRLGRCVGDELFIIPPDGNSVELEGRFVARILTFGKPSYYPFTRETILKQRLHRLQSLTLMSLLKDFKFLAKGDAFVPIAYLQGKKIILYLDNFGGDKIDDRAYDMTLRNYPGIKKKHANSEVVFLPNVGCVDVPKMPWLMLPFSSDYVARTLYADLPGAGTAWYGSAFIAFGEDGKILSRTSVGDRLFNDDIAPLFNDVLRNELFDELVDLESSYGCY